uniref:Chromosome 4 open reading frame 33 n=2 Tax=Cyprinus carpio TaxID=7962 RepID=A0A8C1EYS6_CYPCA
MLNSVCVGCILLTVMEFHIKHTWDSLPVDHEPDGLLMQVTAPFFNHPPAPAGPPGEPFPGLWDYEVVESFFLNNNTEQYLEVEVCPHGQHLILLLNGKHNLPLLFKANIEDNKWKGEALLPWRYFPQGINKMNSYAIHGSGAGRTYEALYPVPREDLQEGQGPDFHQLEYFQDFTLQSIMGDDWVQPESDLWDLASK